MIILKYLLLAEIKGLVLLVGEELGNLRAGMLGDDRQNSRNRLADCLAANEITIKIETGGIEKAKYRVDP